MSNLSKDFESLERRQLLAVQSPYLGTPVNVGSSAVTIQAENFDLGGESVAYHDTTASNIGAQYRAGDAVDIKRISGTTNQYRVSDGVAGEWLEYTLNVATAGQYKFELRVANRDPGSTLHAEIEGVGNITGALSAPDTNSFDTFTTISKTVTLAAGQQVLRIALDANAPANGYGPALDWIKLTQVPAPPPPPPTGQQPFKGSPFAVGNNPVTIQAEDYDKGGQGVAYNDTSPSNTGGAYRTGTGNSVDLKTIAATSGQHRVSDGLSGEWIEYTINVAQAGQYTLDFRVGNRDPGSTFRAEIIGVGNITGAMSVPDTNSFDSFSTVSKTVTLQAGQQVLRFVFDNNAPGNGFGAALDWMRLAPVAIGQPLRVDAGSSSQYTDSLNRVFEAGNGFTGGSNQTAPTFDILERGGPPFPGAPYDDDALLLSYRGGTNFTFSRAIANGEYSLWLEFVEPDPSGVAGQRKFDVSAEGSQILNDFDIVAGAGAQRAIAMQFNVTIVDGKIDLAFAGVVGDAVVSAIMLLPTGIPNEVLPYAGVFDSPDTTLHDAYMDLYNVQSQSKLRQLGQAIYLYSNENRGQFPTDLETLVSREDISHAVLANPRIPTPLPRGELSTIEAYGWADNQSDYLYVPGFRSSTGTPTSILAYENPNRTPSDSLNVLFGDAHVGVMSRAELIARVGGSSVAPQAAPRPLPIAGNVDIVNSQKNLRDISNAMLIYSNVQKGKTPPDLGTLHLTIDVPATTFVNPRVNPDPVPPAGMTPEQTAAWINANTGYVLRAANKVLSRYVNEVVAYEKLDGITNGINLLFGDGHVEFRELRWALEAINRPLP